MQIGPYQIEEEIGRGGMGRVYRARDSDGTVVALKLLTEQRLDHEASRVRFDLEAKALARLDHPNVVPLLGSGEHEGAPWIALQFVEGESLQARIDRGPLSIDEARHVGLELVKALTYVHSLGLLHRDLKPDNVLLRADEVLLTDFGLALDVEAKHARVTLTGMFLGTPGYWSPEQALGERELNAVESDVYGLGAVVYACLTGQPPVIAKSLQEFLKTVQYKRYDSPRRLREGVPEWISSLCMDCLRLIPGLRPSLTEVEHALSHRVAPVRKARKHVASSTPESAFDWRGKLREGASWIALAGLGLVGVVGGIYMGGAANAPAPVADAQRVAEDPHVVRVQACLAEGKQLLREGRYHDAQAQFEEALALEPGLVEAQLGLATSLRRLGDVRRAASRYSTLLRSHPQIGEAYLGRAYCRLELQVYASALTDFEQAAALGATSHAHVEARRREIEAALLARDELRLTRAEDSPRRRLREPDPPRGTTDTERHEKRIRELSSTLAHGPSARLYAERGGSYEFLGDHGRAVEDFGQALELDPTDRFDCRVRRAWSLTLLGRFSEAIAEANKVISASPTQATAYLARGLSRLRLGDKRAAASDLKQALSLGLDPGPQLEAEKLLQEAR